LGTSYRPDLAYRPHCPPWPHIFTPTAPTPTT